MALAFTACDRGADSPAAHIQPATGQPAVQPIATATRYAFSNADSKIEFVGSKVTGQQVGSFGTFRGTVTLPGQDPSAGSVTVDIEMASLSTDNAKLTNHLKSPDFMDAARYPQARFASTAVRAEEAPGANHVMTGDLELHGVTKSIQFPALIQVVADTVVVRATFTIDRKAFGIVYPGMPDDLIRDAVAITLEMRAKLGNS